jgi:hypothetical protein
MLGFGFGDACGGVVLGVRGARQLDAGGGVSGGDEAGTVEACLPGFGFSELRVDPGLV